MVNELKRFCVIVARYHVLIRLADENYLSGVALVAGFITVDYIERLCLVLAAFHLVIIVIYQQYQKNIPLVHL